MDYDLIRNALLFLGCVAFYAALARGLFKVTEQYRWATLEIAERLLEAPNVSNERKVSLQHRLDEVYSGWQAWKLAAIMLCVVATSPFKQPDETRSEIGVPNHLRADYSRFKVYWMVATVGNSPAAAFVFTTFFIIAIAFSASVSAISARIAVARDHHGGGARPA